MIFQGKEGLKWWQGIVEDRNDPLFLNRVRVRIYGSHTWDKQKIATPDLPWSDVMMPTTSPSLSGLGQTTHGLVEGSSVMGFYRDGLNMQDAVVMGSFIGVPQEYSRIDESLDKSGTRTDQEIKRNPADGFNDPRLATAADYEKPPGKKDEDIKPGDPSSPDGKNPEHIQRNYGLTLALDKSPRRDGESSGETYPKSSYVGNTDVNLLAIGTDVGESYPVIEEHSPEPKRSAYLKPTYPFNHVHETESGHVIELDDTPDYERIHLHHRKGTRIEIDKDGNYVEKIVKDKYTVILENDTIKIEGVADIEIGDSSLGSVIGALGGIVGVTDIVGTDLLDKISPDILDQLPDGITTITDKVTEVLDGKLNIGSSNFSEIVGDVTGFKGGESGIAGLVSKVKDAIGTAEGWTDEASTELTDILSASTGTVDSTIATAEKEITNLLSDKLGSETSSVLESVLGGASDTVDSTVSAVTDKVTSALTDTLGAEAAAVVGDQVTAALGGALSGAVGGVLGAGGGVVTIKVGGNANIKVTGTTSVTSLNTNVTSLVNTTLNAYAATTITSPIITSKGVWTHTGAFNVTGAATVSTLLTANTITSTTVITAASHGGLIAAHTHAILSGSSAGTSGPPVP